jgi:hypothetical protein
MSTLQKQTCALVLFSLAGALTAARVALAPRPE